MAYIPNLFRETYFGDQYQGREDTDYIMASLYTFIKLPRTIIANQLALYFLRNENEGGTNPIVVDIRIAEMGDYWYEPSEGINPVLVASNINLTQYLQPPAGWKWIPITEFTFLPDKMYVVRFDVVSAQSVENKLNDLIYCAGAERIPAPYEPGMPPDDYPFPDKLPQKWSEYVTVLGEQPNWGNFTHYPLAVALDGIDEEPPNGEPPEKRKVWPLLLLGAAASAVVVAMIAKKS